MLLNKVSGLSELIILNLAHKDSLSFDAIQKEIANSRTVSVSALYKELSKLQDEGVIVKVSKNYSLKMTWVISTANFFANMFSFQIQNCSKREIIPDIGKSYSWKFTSLARVDDFWEQVLFSLFSYSKQKEVIGWMPHTWFHITDNSKQSIYSEAMKARNIKIYRLIGSNSYLDRSYMKNWREPVCAVSYGASPFDGQNSLYFDVVDDYIFSIKLSKDSTQKIENYYNQITCEDDFKNFKGNNPIEQPIVAHVKLQHNTRKARRLRRQLCDYWSLPYRYK